MVNWRAAPFIRFLIPLLSGLVFGSLFPSAKPCTDAVLAALLILLAVIGLWRSFRWRWLFGAIGFLFLTALGHKLHYRHSELNDSQHFSYKLQEHHSLIGMITEPPKLGKRSRVNLQIKGLHSDSTVFEVATGNLLLSLEMDSVSRSLQYGDMLYVCKLPVRIPPPVNPETFDFRQFAHGKNVHYQVFAGPGEWHRLERFRGNSILLLAFRIRKRFLKKLRNHLPTQREYAVGSALILGERNLLDVELKAAYQQTGAIHILAISGLHVGLFAGFIALLLGWRKTYDPLWKWVKTLILLGCLWAFAVLTGASASALRAAFMFSLLIIGLSMRRSSNIYNTIAASAFCLLIFNPYLIKDLSFQLSYLAVIGIVYFAPKIYRQWYIPSRFARYFWQLTAVALAAQLTTFPISLYYFHQFPVYFLLSGWVVVPLAPVVLFGGASVLLFGQIPWLGWLLGQFLYWVLWLMNAFILLIQRLPGLLIADIWVGLGSTVILYLLIIAGIFLIEKKTSGPLLFGSCMILALTINFRVERFILQQNRELIIYHIKHHTLIDFNNGYDVVSLHSNAIPALQIEKAATNYRRSVGNKKLIEVALKQNDIQTEELYYDHPFAQFYDKRIAFIDQPLPAKPLERIKVNWILVRNNAAIDLTSIEEYFEFEEIIFDGSNNGSTVRRWIEICQEKKWKFRNTFTDGAFRTKL